MTLVDTHALAWWLAGSSRLSPAARRAIAREQAAGGLAVASVTLMELAQLAARGEIRTGRTPVDWLRQVVVQARVAVREVTPDIAAMAAFLPPAFPADPFDRLITATAIVEKAPLVTADRRIQDSGVVRTIW